MMGQDPSSWMKDKETYLKLLLMMLLEVVMRVAVIAVATMDPAKLCRWAVFHLSRPFTIILVLDWHAVAHMRCSHHV